MKLAIRRHVKDVVAIVVMLALFIGCMGYILGHQTSFTVPSWFPFIGKSYYTVRADFSAANAIVPGQGQTVNVSGVEVGTVGGVQLEGGVAQVTLQIQQRYAPIYRDATLLLRPRTPLKDMFVALDPGTPAAGALPSGGLLPASQTNPDVSVDEVLRGLDGDTRTYLELLLAAGGEALPGRAAADDLRGALKRFDPLAVDTRAVAGALAARRANLSHLIHSLSLIAGSLGGVDVKLGQLIQAADQGFRATAAQDANLRAALAALPPTLGQAQSAFGRVSALAGELGPALGGLQPFARGLAPSLAASERFFRATTGVIEHKLRPFAPAVEPIVRELEPATLGLAVAVPQLRSTVAVLNTIFNEFTHNPGGRQQSFEFWGAWLAHISPSLTTFADANGATLRALPLLTCAQLDALYQVELGNPSLGPILIEMNLADRTKLCPEDRNLGATGATGPTALTGPTGRIGPTGVTGVAR